MRSQLPFVPAFFPATGSNPGQQCPFLPVPWIFFFAVCEALRVEPDLDAADFRAVAIPG